MNGELTDAELRQARRKPIFDSSALTGVDYDRRRVEELLPHRGRFLLVDRITGVDYATGRVMGRRKLDPDDPVFADHFPGMPIYPGVLMVEMIAQFAICLAALSSASRDKGPPAVRLVRIRNATFVKEARPGDELTALAQINDDGGRMFSALGQAIIGDAVLCVAWFEGLLGTL